MNEEQEEYTEEPTTFTDDEVKDILHPHTHLMEDIIQIDGCKGEYTLDEIGNTLIHFHEEEKSLMTSTLVYITKRIDWAVEYMADKAMMATARPNFEMPPLREYIDTEGECLWEDVSDQDIQPEPISAQAFADVMADTASWQDVSHLFDGIEMEEEE